MSVLRSSYVLCGRGMVVSFLMMVIACAASSAQSDARSELAISTTNTNRFVAVHGQQAVLMGYPQEGLEVWGYPLQILDKYRIGFSAEGTTTEADGRPLLRRLIYAPGSVTRIYVGPDFVVRETLFVPLDRPAAIIRYQVEAARPVDIVVHFTPVLNLMWPGALGGQSTEWKDASSSYVLAEYTRDLSAVVGSPETIAHDSTVNSTFNNGSQFSFTVRPTAAAGSSVAEAIVVAAMQPFDQRNSSSTVRELAGSLMRLEQDASKHYELFEEKAMRIETPDAEVNSAIAWSEISLEQSWVCNPQLGCGMIAGYGPSRAGRRPQYDWFFGGDGLVATNAFIASGRLERAREELEFILKYQDAKTGMVWHELSQSAGYIDWSKYPYMFVHVDITFDFLATVARYVQSSGDTQFARDHWSSIAKAYAYCHALIHEDHLPHIPAGKEGGDEQNRPADDMALSTSWVVAAKAYAQLAKGMGIADEAANAERESQLAREAVATHYWNAKEDFWLDGHTASGSPIFTRRSGFGEALAENIFSATQREAVLDQIASSKFQTDWGTRGAAVGTTNYDPWSYTTASTSALQSASTAATFWQADRPLIAEGIWRAIVPLNMLDAPGHLHEVLAGNVYAPGTESVPEQTWSSAGFLDATVKGMLGLSVNGIRDTVTFRPHLPAQWSGVSIENITLPHSRLALTLHQQIDGLQLDILNNGESTAISFEPQIPLGARILSARCDGRNVKSTVQANAEDEHAMLSVEARPGTTSCSVQIEGGVSVIVPQTDPELGNASVGMKITHLELKADRLLLDADAIATRKNIFEVQTPWTLSNVEGGVVHLLSPHLYEVQVDRTKEVRASDSYQSVHLEMTFAHQ